MLDSTSPPGSLGVRREGPFTRVLAGVIQTSGRGWEQLMCVARRGFHVSCELGPPCEVKSRIDSPSLSVKRTLVTVSHHSKEVKMRREV